MSRAAAGVKTPPKLPDYLVQRLHRVTDLFATGKAIVLNDENPMDPVAVWVQKLNSFQRQDALRDAEYGRAKRQAALTEDTEEIKGIRLRLVDYDDDKLIQHTLSPRNNDFWMAARDDVLADEKWAEIATALRDADTARRDGSYVPEEEENRLLEVSTSFVEAITQAMERRTQDAVRELKTKSREEVEQEYVESYRRLKGAEAWQDEYNRTEVWYALRDCVPRPGQDPRDHAAHEHPQLLQARSLIYELPDELLEQVQGALRELTMPAAEAGNSDAPRSSSASAEQPGTEEGSTPSTPAETSTQPAGTSSTPSEQPQPSSDG